MHATWGHGGRGPSQKLVRGAILALVWWSSATLLLAQEINWTEGPSTVSLDNQAVVYLEEGYLFAGADDTKTIMELTGNVPSDYEVGLIAPAAEGRNWFLVFEYFPVGYVSDDDRDEIDAAALLKSFSEATEASNEYRRENGFEGLHIVGWNESPHYDRLTHNLVWAIDAKDDAGQLSVNYNVRLLGREGYMSATLVTDPGSLAADKPEVEKILEAFTYNQGKRYAEFREGDKLAGYGLTALLAGGAGAAALKLGLFGKLFKVLAKAWKLVIVALLAVGGAIKKVLSSLFGQREPVAMGPRTRMPGR